MKKIVIFFIVGIFLYGAPSLGEEFTSQINSSWSPYISGALIGLLVCLTLFFSDRPIGASSFYATLAGFIGKSVAPKHTLKLDYFKENPPKINWEFMFVVAAVFGSAIAAIHGNEFSLKGLPSRWVTNYGADSWLLYTVISFFGGVLMAFGSRLSGGCTSGHGISGTSQLSASSWISVICFFIGGVLAVRIIY